MFADEARFGRMNRPRPCWAPIGIRPEVACQLIREYVYLYGAVSPKDGTCVYLIMPAPDTECFQIFLEILAKKYPKDFILLFVDGAGNHHSDELEIPANIILHLLPPYSRVLLFIHDAKRKIRIFCVSWRSAMNFVRDSLFAGPMRNSGSVWRSAFATTNSDGGMPGRMVRSQDPKELQTSLGAATARYWSNPWATTPAWMKAW